MEMPEELKDKIKESGQGTEHHSEDSFIDGANYLWSEGYNFTAVDMIEFHSWYIFQNDLIDFGSIKMEKIIGKTPSELLEIFLKERK